ncbi:hypothetical protein [Paucihalobacter sp.]|uniref:hypothetical protein n=1 Tax=Paucihalobacter sp. TaxID=2850405 RepID=UPI002FE13D00
MRTNILQDSIEEKIQNAPDSSYEIGIFIGSMLPFVVLIVIAYLIYNYSKNRNKEK